MNTSTTMRATALCALLATTCLVAPANAQTTDAPSAYKNIDENGVDLTDGSFNFSMVEGSIGSGEGLLSLIRYDAGGSSLDNWEGLSLRIDGGVATVSLGDRSETFTNNGTGFVAEQGNGATLTGGGSNYTYRDASGTEMLFAPPPSTAPCGTGACVLPALNIREPNGKTVSLRWEVAGGRMRLLEVSNNLGYAMHVAYRSGGIVDGQVTQAWFDRVSVTFRNTAVPGSPTPAVTYATPEPGVTQITDMGGRTWRITTNAQGQVIGIKRPGATGDSTQVFYDMNGVSQLQQDGITTNYSRTVTGTTATTVVSDAAGTRRRTVMSNLTSGRPTQVIDAFGRTTLYQYDSNDRLTEVTAPEGNKRISILDARGNAHTSIARAKVPTDGTAALPDIVTRAGYDETCANAAICNQPRWIEDARGARTEYAYDAAGNVTSVLSPAPVAGAVRPQTRYGYAALAAPGGGSVSMLRTVSACQVQSVCATAADEALTMIAYDDPNLLPSLVTTGAGDFSLTARTAMRYDAIGNLTSVDGPLAGPADTTRIHYNASREVEGTIGADPDGAGPLKHRAQLLRRNADGDVTVTLTGTAAGQTRADLDAMSALEAVHTGYDNRRVVYRSRDEGSVVTEVAQVAYDARGRAVCVTQRMDPAKYRGALPNACEMQLPAGPDGHDRRTIMIYDAMDRPIERFVASGLPEDAREFAAAYTPNGQVALLVDANGNKTDYAYDGHDRLCRTSYPVQTVGADTSNPNDHEELTYDPRSLVTRMRLRDGNVINLAYDALGRIVSKDVPNTAFFEKDVTYSYDNLGRLTNASYIGSFGIAFGYDALGRKTRETNSAFGTTLSEYDLAGRRTRLTWRDGFAVGYKYLVTGETASIAEATGTAPITLATFAYDDRGRRTSLTRGNGTTTGYAYDLGSRLSSLTHDLAGTAHDVAATFGYNPASQIVGLGRDNDLYAFTRTAAGDTDTPVDGLNRLTRVGSAPVGHDARGNLASDGARTYGYTSENRLATVSGQASTDLAYDPLGRLFHINRSETDLRYDGSEVIEESVAFTGALRRRYVHGPGVDEPLVSYDNAGNRRWLHADERGSIVATSDQSGTAVAIAAYDEYGMPQGEIADRFGYTGQMWLPEVGVYSYKARMYDPGLGRFLQSDPIGYAGGMNLYGYVGADPVNKIDPMGLLETTGSCPAPVYDSSGDVIEFSVCAPSGGGGYTGITALMMLDDLFGRNRDILNPPGNDIDTAPEPVEAEIVVTARRPHRYVLPYVSPCPASVVFDYFKQAGHSAPGAPATREGFTPRIVLYGGNPISQYVNSSTGTIVNTTLNGHRYFPGTVTIQVTPLSAQTSTIVVTGEGTGAHARENVILGKAWFGAQAAGAQNACGR